MKASRFALAGLLSVIVAISGLIACSNTKGQESNQDSVKVSAPLSDNSSDNSLNTLETEFVLTDSRSTPETQERQLEEIRQAVQNAIETDAFREQGNVYLNAAKMEPNLLFDPEAIYLIMPNPSSGPQADDFLIFAKISKDIVENKDINTAKTVTPTPAQEDFLKRKYQEMVKEQKGEEGNRRIRRA
jgi:hypothetical protein